MPRLSDTMEEGTISSWLKNVGDDVSEGDILAEIETDKATMEFESFYNGKLVHIGVQAGETVNVDDLIAIISDGEVDVEKLLKSYAEGTETETNEDSANENVEPIIEDSQSSEQVESVPIDSDKRIIASPLAKKIAIEKNIDLSTIQGSGDNGRIIKSDLDNVDSSQPNLDENKTIQISEDQNQCHHQL